MKTWLVLDCHYLCHRNFHAMGDLKYEDTATGVLFGFFRDVQDLQELHDTRNIVFCFDKGRSKRYDMLAGYKRSRAERYKSESEIDKEKRKELQKQISLLRDKELSKIGFKNVLSQDGYEGDDVIASVIHNLSKNELAIIVGTDQDLYQLLNKRVTIWNPHKTKAVTYDSVREEYGIGCEQWADVKAIAGCKSDDIPGVVGVGEKTAASYLSGQLKGGKKFEAITAGNGQWRKNLKIVKLPLKGTGTFELQEDKVTPKKWDKIMRKYGMSSLKDKGNGKSKKKKKRKAKGFGF